MKLWLISQKVNSGWDAFDSAVVASDTEEKARHTGPDGTNWQDGVWVSSNGYIGNGGSWVSPESVTVELIGTAKRGTKAGVVCASFNAG